MGFWIGPPYRISGKLYVLNPCPRPQSPAGPPHRCTDPLALEEGLGEGDARRPIGSIDAVADVNEVETWSRVAASTVNEVEESSRILSAEDKEGVTLLAEADAAEAGMSLSPVEGYCTLPSGLRD